jgi:hypothetical protein
LKLAPILSAWPTFRATDRPRTQANQGLSDEFIEHLYQRAPLHDIGKIGIPDRSLLNPGPRDCEERQLMEIHEQKGMDILERTRKPGPWTRPSPSWTDWWPQDGSMPTVWRQ